MRWAVLLFLLFELWLLIAVGGRVGAGWTVMAVVASALLGLTCLRRQALALLLQPQQLLAGDAQQPLNRLAEAGLLAAAGLLLILPGFLTDALGLLLVLPPLRRRLARRWLARQLPPDGFAVIDGEFVVVRPRTDESDRLPPR